MVLNITNKSNMLWGNHLIQTWNRYYEINKSGNVKNFEITDIQFNGIVNAKNQIMRRIQSVIQKLSIKFTTYENAPIVVTWTELYKHFWIKTITESVFIVSKKNILKVSHLNCVGICRSMRDIDKETIGIDK
jgi:hypothetical protein